jgi:4-amino-4-deoxy-L-arabinose transferase-like glycosyltransferase
MRKKLLKEILSHKLVYLLLFLILVLGFILRFWNLDRLLGFYYDQGRDALVIWDLIHKGKFFLIGPTTGLAGIFRAPYYYYLIAPFYLIGRGNPLFVSAFLITTTMLAVVFIYCLGAKIQNRATGLIAAVIASFSFNLVIASRWLSNPTPMLLLSMILVWAMLEVAKRSPAQRSLGGVGWPVIAAVAGLSLFSFGSAGELFYLPAIAVFAIWNYKNLPKRKTLLITLFIFFLTFAPLVLFDLKHGGIMRGNMAKTFVGEKSFTLPTKFLFNLRTPFYYDVFTNKIFHYRGKNEKVFLAFIAFAFFIFLPKYLKNKNIKTVLLLLVSPIVGLYFYQGNATVLYDYYLTGYFLIFILLFAIVLGSVWKYKPGKILVICFLWYFLNSNYAPLHFKLTDKSQGPGSIAFINQKQIIDWVYQDALGKNFNVDVYVPPVISYAYDYLFKWLPTTPGLRGASRQLVEERVPLLYTVFEQDTDHPERLEAWLARQKGIGKVEKEFRSGAIIVQRRIRI